MIEQDVRLFVCNYDRKRNAQLPVKPAEARHHSPFKTIFTNRRATSGRSLSIFSSPA